MAQERSELARALGTIDAVYRARRAAVAVNEEALAVPLLVGFVAIVVPAWTLPAALTLTGLLLVRLVFVFWRTRLDPRRLERRLGLGDGLSTWMAFRGRAAGPALPWLERALLARLGREPGKVGAAVAARRFRPLRAVFPVLVALILLLLFCPPLPEGAIPLPVDGVASSGGTSAPDAGGGERPADPSPSATDEPLPEPTPEPLPEESPEVEQPTVPEDPAPDPKALLEDPALADAFAIPQFVGEGGGEVRTVPVAAIDEQPAIAPPPPPPPAATGAEAGGEPPPDSAEATAFERALERALRARHIPEDERAFVRRWFTSLVESTK